MSDLEIKQRKKRAPLTEEQKRVRRVKRFANKLDRERFKRYVDREVYKFVFVENFKRPYREIFRGWTEEESKKKMDESKEEFRSSFSFKDFQAGIFKDSTLDEEIIVIKRIEGEEIDTCKHNFEKFRGSRVCTRCAKVSTEKVFCMGQVDFKGKSFSMC